MVVYGEAHINKDGREVVFPVDETIIRGTGNTGDLVEAFEGWLETTDPKGYEEAMQRKEDYYMDDEDGETFIYLDEWLHEALIEIMYEYAPDGYYFGPTQGDSSDYGFWREHCGEQSGG